MKVYLDSFLGNTFFSSQEYSDGKFVVPIGTKFTFFARDKGRFIYRYHLLTFSTAY